MIFHICKKYSAENSKFSKNKHSTADVISGYQTAASVVESDACRFQVFEQSRKNILP